MTALRGARLTPTVASAPMAIYLGRAHQGQSERPEVDPRESNEIAEVARSVRGHLAALAAESN